jgi:hypothetical protein
MTEKKLGEIRDCIDNEGFDYCFIHYSNFENIKDDEFHKLIKEYKKAHAALAKYLKIDE